jgi:hypothetical protein
MVIKYFSILLGNIRTTIIFDSTFRESSMKEQVLSLKKINEIQFD